LPGAPNEIAPKRFVLRAPAIYELKNPAPMLAWYGALRRVPKGAELGTLLTVRDEAGIRREAVLAQTPLAPDIEARVSPLLAANKTSPPSVAGEITRFSTEIVDGQIDAPAAGIVVLNEFMFPGWRVYVDGQEQTPIWIDLCLRGVLVGPGKHVIRWAFTPRRLPILTAAWVLGVAVFMGTALQWARGQSKRSVRVQPASPHPAEMRA
jgi:hypothetical protein